MGRKTLNLSDYMQKKATSKRAKTPFWGGYEPAYEYSNSDLTRFIKRALWVSLSIWVKSSQIIQKSKTSRSWEDFEFFVCGPKVHSKDTPIEDGLFSDSQPREGIPLHFP